MEKVLKKAGYDTESVGSGNEAKVELSKKSYDVVLSDLMMPDGDGIALLRNIRKNFPNIEVILLTGYGTIENAVEAMKEGAYDFITKPVKKAIILNTVERAIDHQNLTQENKYLKSQLGKSEVYDEIIGNSQALRDVLELVDRVAPLVSTVLITGASGTGKELIARTIHRRSPRAKKRFVPINCAAIPENLIESELFGHIRGAFTGALRDKSGLFKAADGGTVFLDEISSVPFPLQVKLLRAIELKEILPVGSTTPEIVDVRIIAATNKNLAIEVEKGLFREDLYYRLNVIGINIPPLKERKDDIPELVEYFIKSHNVRLNKHIRGIDPHVMTMLMESEWKGNVRELENAIERAIILCDVQSLTLEHFPHLSPQGYATQKQNADLKSSVRRFEENTIMRALEAADQDKSRAAQILGLSLSSLYRKLAELGIKIKD
jgi:DNA-binding NtrC family response regulator